MKNMNYNIKSLYLCVNDMDRAVKFYENFFEQKVSKKDDIYSIFEINGFRLGLFAYQKVNEKHIFGSNFLPSIEVDNVEILKNKIKDLKIVFELKEIGDNYVAEFEDCEGNHIEITAPVQKNTEIHESLMLEGDRIEIRPLSLNELIHINNKEFEKLPNKIERKSLIQSTSNAIAKKIVKMENVIERLHPWYTYWLIIDKSTDHGIGFIGFKGIPDKDGYVEVGYSISPDFRKKGLMTEALNMLIEWTSIQKNCNGITAYALKENIGSIKVLTKCGFKLMSYDDITNYYLLQLSLK